MFTPLSTPTRRPEQRPPREAALSPWLAWRIERPHERHVLSVAELAACRCPDICDRDHDNE